jgi:hypothetical protein
MACALYALGYPTLCAKYLDLAEEAAEQPAELALLCQSACETGAHDLALMLLRATYAEQPYVPGLLHMLAAAFWNTGQIRQALQHWATLRRLDPGNLVAWVMHERAKRRVEQGDVQEPVAEETCSYHMELAAEDAVEKLLEVQQTLRQGREALQKRFDTDAEFAAILAWGLTVRDENAATSFAMLTMLGTLYGERAEGMLLGVLTDPVQSDEMKREAIGLLARRGLCGPYYMERGGRVLRVMGQALPTRAELPPGCERILQAAVDRLTPRYGDVVRELSGIWLPFLDRRADPAEPLRRPRVWIAALEYVYRANVSQPVSLIRLSTLRRVSPRALRRRVWALLPDEKPQGEA